MVSEKNRGVKGLTLIVSASIIIMSCLDGWHWNDWGVTRDCDIIGRLCYPWVHASLLHALVNVWCLMSVVFIYDVSLGRLLTAYIIAVCVPGFALSDVPTVGLSTVCYALMGSLSFEVRRKAYFQSWMAFYIGIGFLFPSVNAIIHVYGYMAGLIVGLLNAPMPWLRRSNR